MKKTAIALAIATVVSAMALLSQPAMANSSYTPYTPSYTIACQGLDVRSVGEGATGPAGSDSALWSVVVSGSKFTSGNLTAMYTNDPGPTGGEPALTCYYTLDSTSSFTTANGMVLQTLVWDFVSKVSNGSTGTCTTGSFTDHVYLISNGQTAAMTDDNLEDDDTAGSGTCNLQQQH